MYIVTLKKKKKERNCAEDESKVTFSFMKRLLHSSI